MSGFTFFPEDVTRILSSLALARARGAFIPGGADALAAMPPGTKSELASAAAHFFGLGEASAAACAVLPSWAMWAEHILAALPPEASRRYTFFTSGSTGTPKPVVFSPRQLDEETASLAPLFTDRRRVVSVMPVHHVFGFVFALALPRRLGIPVLDLPPLPTAAFFRQLRAGDLVLAFPVFWQSVLDIHRASSGLSHPENLHGITSSSPCPPHVVEGLLGLGRTDNGRPRPEDALSGEDRPAFLSGMTEIYGATEFGAVGARRCCREPYALLPHWRKEPLPPAPGGKREGGRAEADEWGIRRREGDVLPLSDVVEWNGERQFVPVARKDAAVQVGGVNVFPARVAETLRAHPKVRDCAVRLMRPDEGVRLKAFVVPEIEGSADRQLAGELKAWLARRLEPAATPRAVRIGKALPRTPSGKLTDWDAFS